MIAQRIRGTAQHLRDIADTELAEYRSDPRAWAMANRLRLLAGILDDDARIADRLENSVLTPAARAGFSVVTGGGDEAA
jgi:hypothetical protein